MKALLRIAPLVTARELREPERARRQMFQEGAIAPWPGREVSVVIDHDPERRVGRVLEFAAFDDAVAGRQSRWLYALAEITEPPPEWLRRGGGVSFCHANLGRVQEMPGGWLRVLKAYTDEVTLCSPAFRPVEPLAQVVHIGEARAARDASAGTEVLTPPGVVLRRGGGQVLGVR